MLLSDTVHPESSLTLSARCLYDGGIARGHVTGSLTLDEDESRKTTLPVYLAVLFHSFEFKNSKVFFFGAKEKGLMEF